LPQRGLLLELPFRGERDHEVKRAQGINYMMNFQVETMSKAVFGKTHHDLARMGMKRGLFVPFLLEGMADDLDKFQPDRIHPTAAAQPILLDNVWKALRPLLKAP
jgi:hypothetical protein